MFESTHDDISAISTQGLSYHHPVLGGLARLLTSQTVAYTDLLRESFERNYDSDVAPVADQDVFEGDIEAVTEDKI